MANPFTYEKERAQQHSLVSDLVVYVICNPQFPKFTSDEFILTVAPELHDRTPLAAFKAGFEQDVVEVWGAFLGRRFAAVPFNSVLKEEVDG